MALLLTILLIALGIVIHELSHSAVAALFGVRTRAVLIGIPPIGRLLFTVRGAPVRLGRYPAGFGVDLDDDAFAQAPRFGQALISLAGPISGIILTPLMWMAGYPMAAIATALLSLTNLIPLPPLDGGMAISFILRVPKERRDRIAARGTRILNGISVGLLALSGLLFAVGLVAR